MAKRDEDAAAFRAIQDRAEAEHQPKIQALLEDLTNGVANDFDSTYRVEPNLDRPEYWNGTDGTVPDPSGSAPSSPRHCCSSPRTSRPHSSPLQSGSYPSSRPASLRKPRASMT